MPTSERMGAFATPSRTRSGNGLHSAPTPRQAAIAAKKASEEEKKRQAMVIKQQREELKAAAKAKQEAIMAQQQLSLKKRAETAQRQREAAAAARKTARERQTAVQAKELQASMKENRELRERLLKEEKERRRNSLVHRNAAWSRERDLKKRLQKERQEEQKMIMEAHAVFLEAKDRLKKEQALAHRQELIWRSRNKECRWRERESRDGRRRTFCDEMEIWGRELDRQMGLEEGTTHRLYRQDCEEYERCLSELKKEDEEYKRMELTRYRLFKQQEELKRKEQEAKERSILLEDRESVLESKKKEEEAELDRREALREVPLETRKIDIVEALWARQTQTPATRGRRRLQLHSVQELGTPETSVEANASIESALLHSVEDVDTTESNAEANASLESGAASEVSIDVGGEFGIGYSDSSIVSSSTSNVGPSNWDEGKKNLRLEVPERDLDMEAIYCTAGLSSGPSWSESSVFEARGVTAEAAEVLAAAEQSFSSSESLDEAGANAVASAAIFSPVADSVDKSRFPVRALVFPSSPVGDCVKEVKGEEGMRGLLEKEGDHDGTEVSATVMVERCSGLEEGTKAGDMNLCSSGNNKENSSLAAGAQGGAAESSNEGAVAMMPLTVDMVASLDRGDGLSCPTAPSPTGSDDGDEEEVIVG